MKKRVRFISAVAFTALFTLGCSSKDDQETVPDKSPVVLYEDAQRSLQAGNYGQAADVLEALDARYPFGPHSEQVQLDLIYAYYKSEATAQAMANIDRFLRLSPTHKDIDYVYYMRGLTNMAMSATFFHGLLNIDRFDRNIIHYQNAFMDFKRLLQRYPDSIYAADAQARMIGIKDSLARYEIEVAEWYLKRDAYVAAINRGKYVLTNFPDTKATEAALDVMLQGYTALNVEAPKARTLQVMKANFPNNKWVR
ncbi:outer membrane protein assembly factor BamD [Motilimonas eburnea]|uniref:outer membrane protein assembly factor BamD n=1 Tax=Motilimonas eburnea TaxID=1737488 RepID=UPI001E5741AF|nr:outer membrane protein assembly factor BamD [Motilimonas eburnea]MCE2573607.1 outer membrane protein assembly factor BamD [Motilimonas eburnea]